MHHATCCAQAYEGECGEAVERRALFVAEELDEDYSGGGADLEDLVQADAVQLQAKRAKRQALRAALAT